MEKKNKSNKFRFTCTAPSELTQYNKSYNDSLKVRCKNYRETYHNIFDPNLKCAGCDFLKVKKYT